MVKLGHKAKNLFAVLAGIYICLTPLEGQSKPVLGLAYDSLSRSPVPIPPSERNLQTVTASPFFKVSANGWILEGATFDRKGNLLFCDVSNKRVMCLSPQKQLSTFVTLDSLSPGGLAIDKEGRIYIAAMDLSNASGGIFMVNSRGLELKTVLSPTDSYMPNDLVLDRSGGIYFTDFRGTSTEPKGGVYYMSPDRATTKSVVPHLAQANGVALSPNGKTLWTIEFARNLLHRIELKDATTITPIGSAIAYRFVGPAPDSMRADADGNVYVAIYGQGRVLVFNRNGIPIGQILLPGREQGHNLNSTSLAIRPGTNDLFIVTSDGENGKGANIFHTKSFAKGLATN